MKVLIAEDEQDTRKLLQLYFAGRGHEVTCTADGREAWELFQKLAPDLVLVDIRMPEMDGWQLIEFIRARSQTPLIVISALDGADHAVRGLELGADDYLRKPFELSELESRIRAVIRRTGQPDERPPPLGPISIDDTAKRVLVNGEPVRLTPREYELLKLLVGSPKTVFSHRRIIELIWPPGNRAESSDVKQYVYLLRAKVEQDPGDPRYIKTVKGFGYQYDPA